MKPDGLVVVDTPNAGDLGSRIGFLLHGEGLWAPIEDVYSYTDDPSVPREPDEVIVAFTDGAVTSIDGRPVTMLDAVQELNRLVYQSKEIHPVILPLRDGVTVAVKKT